MSGRFGREQTFARCQKVIGDPTQVEALALEFPHNCHRLPSRIPIPDTHAAAFVVVPRAPLGGILWFVKNPKNLVPAYESVQVVGGSAGDARPSP